MLRRNVYTLFICIAFVFTAVSLAGITQAAASEPTAAEVSFWDAVKDSDDPEELQLYLDEYPDGHYAALARLKLKKMGADGEEAGPAAAAGEAPVQEIDPDATSLRVEGMTDLTGRGVLSGSEVLYAEANRLPETVVVPANSQSYDIRMFGEVLRLDYQTSDAGVNETGKAARSAGGLFGGSVGRALWHGGNAVAGTDDKSHVIMVEVQVTAESAETGKQIRRSEKVERSYSRDMSRADAEAAAIKEATELAFQQVAKRLHKL
ncbi:MAG: hypothetical protein R3360_02135 [Alphaproteobacteria bacterium]|nr:hypothetical protein [Alphaproteobacteria bacterium]